METLIFYKILATFCHILDHSLIKVLSIYIYIYTFWKEEVERDLQVLGVRRWRESVAGHCSTGQSPVGCSANGGRRRRIYIHSIKRLPK